jgi:uncharacterized protein YjdB
MYKLFGQKLYLILLAMKRLLVVFFLFTSLVANSTTYYVAPKGGNDSYPGTDINYPWATWYKAFDSTSTVAGDTVYFRGGVYMAPAANGLYGQGARMYRNKGTKTKPICLFAYPADFAAGNIPILDLSNVTGSSFGSGRFYGVILDECQYIHLKGLTVRNIWCIDGDDEALGFSFYNSNHVTVEQCVSYNTRNIGFDAVYSDSIFYINCDAYNHCDSLNPVNPGNDGYGFTSYDADYPGQTVYTTNIFYTGCRAWNNGDDGFAIANCGLSTIDSCWAFNNGTLLGAGDGFKLGWIEAYGVNYSLNRKLTRSLAVYNRAWGILTNEDPSSNYTGSMQVYNNTSYHNGYYPTRFPGAGTHGFYVDDGHDPDDDHQLARVFRNNLSYDNEDGEFLLAGGALYTHSNNSWDSDITLSDADFLDLDSATAIAILKGPRKSDGSLPDLGNFLKLASGSDCREAGVDVGLPFSGTAPDIGFSETNNGEIVLVTGITVTGAGNATSIVTDKGTLQLNKTVLPANATNQTVTWSIADGAAFATISSTGLVKAVNNGTATAKATAKDGSGVSGTFTFTILNQIIQVASISVSGAGGSTTITTDGGTLQLSATVLPANATNKNVTWSILNETGEATITAYGLVTAVGNGTVTARATANDGSGISGILTITIYNQIIPVSDLSVSGSGDASIITSLGGTLQLNASVLPENATDKTVTWSIVNNTGQAAISSTGLVTAVNNGTVTTRATANDGTGVSETFTITISDQLIPVSGIFVTSENGENTLNLGELTLQLSAAISPENVTDKTYTWSIDLGTGQATINSTGLVTALANGTVAAVAKANDGSGVSGSFDIAIQSFSVSASETRIVYIDPTNQSDPSQNGTLDHPYGSWSMITWKEGYSYLQKRGTISYESKINITSGGVTMGSYDEGEQPVIQSNANDYGLLAFNKSNLLIKDLHIIAVSAVSSIYIMGESVDDICISNCTLEGAENGVRILNGKNIVIRYNTFINCSEAIYCYAENSSIYYNVFRDNEVAINTLANAASAEISNNVFFNNIVGISNTYTELTLYNNIFYLVNNTDKAFNNRQLNQLISDNNVFYPEQKGFIQIGDKVYSSLVDYQRDFGLDLNSITDDPEFVDAFNQNYTLETYSPCINAGKLIGLQQDYFGTKVPSGGLPDIGLAEWNNPSGSVTSSISHLSDPVQEDFQVYPNPSQGIFNVSVKNNNSDASTITIKDLSGKTVYKNIYSSGLDFEQEINISTFQKGIYIVAVEDNTRTLSQPIIIK